MNWKLTIAMLGAVAVVIAAAAIMGNRGNDEAVTTSSYSTPTATPTTEPTPTAVPTPTLTPYQRVAPHCAREHRSIIGNDTTGYRCGEFTEKGEVLEAERQARAEERRIEAEKRAQAAREAREERE